MANNEFPCGTVHKIRSWGATTMSISIYGTECCHNTKEPASNALILHPRPTPPCCPSASTHTSLLATAKPPTVSRTAIPPIYNPKHSSRTRFIRRRRAPPMVNTPTPRIINRVSKTSHPTLSAPHSPSHPIPLGSAPPAPPLLDPFPKPPRSQTTPSLPNNVHTSNEHDAKEIPRRDRAPPQIRVRAPPTRQQSLKRAGSVGEECCRARRSDRCFVCTTEDAFREGREGSVWPSSEGEGGGGGTIENEVSYAVVPLTDTIDTLFVEIHGRGVVGRAV